jgi:hypothetical protein
MFGARKEMKRREQGVIDKILAAVLNRGGRIPAGCSYFLVL